jgi:type 1 glutamine amidotransferase
LKRALIVWGGWEGHQPKEAAEFFRRMLEGEGFDVEVSDTLQAFADAEQLKPLDLIIPNWTMGKIDQALVENVSAPANDRLRCPLDSPTTSWTEKKESSSPHR